MNGEAETISLVGELDLANARLLEARLRESLRAGNRTVVLDMRELTFIDSTGIAVLVAALREDGDGRRLRFVPSDSPEVSRVLSLTGVEAKLPLADSGRDGQQDPSSESA